MAKVRSISPETARITYRVVKPSEIDELGHVNNAVYVAWVQDAAVEHWEFAASLELREKYVWVCARHEIDYRAQFLVDDDVIVRTWLGHSKGARFDRFVEFAKDGQPHTVASARTTWVLINRNSGKPVRVGREILESFSLM